MDGSGLGAGPPSTLPVVALYREPWQGQSSSDPAGATVQPWWVQMALNAPAVSADGRATMIGLPSESWAETAEPTLMLASVASAFPEPPAAELVAPPSVELSEPESAELSDPPPPPQAASSSAQPTPVPARSIRRSTPRCKSPDSVRASVTTSAVAVVDRSVSGSVRGSVVTRSPWLDIRSSFRTSL